ncbi:MAG: signal peptidase I [Thermoanaerobaculia bacterium]
MSDAIRETAGDAAEPESSVTRGARYLWKEWILPFLIIAICLGSLRSALADWNDVPTASMKPTIVEGDRVVVNKVAYDLKVPFTTTHISTWTNPKRGDIVVFFSPKDGTRLVKRVIGLPGDVIEIRDERVVINGRAMSYRLLEGDAVDAEGVRRGSRVEIAQENLDGVHHDIMLLPDAPALRTYGPIQVPPNSYFVMGDNRDDSYDSRYLGPIPRKRIVGRATAVAFSLDYGHYFLPRANRWFRELQ